MNFTVTFSEPVSTLTSSGLTVSNGTATITGSGATYNVAVMPSVPGSVSVSVPGGVGFGGASGVWNSPSASSSVTFSPPVMYVDSSGDDTKCGWSWADAKLTIQSAITAAAQGAGVPAIWVTKGHYYGPVTVPYGVGLYGGFNVGDSSANGRTFPADSTGASDPSQASIIDGQGSGTVVSATATNYMNILNGFTVENGNVGVSASTTMNVYNCNVCSNVSTGIDYLDSANGIVQNNYVYANSGGGVVLNTQSSVTVWSNHIHHNSLTGIVSNSSVGCTINGNWIEYNNPLQTTEGGGISV